MGREIVQMSVGQCGNQIGQNFWRSILEEHSISLDGAFLGDADSESHLIQKLSVYMRETASDDAKHSNHDSYTPRYVPRSIMLELEPGVVRLLARTKRGAMVRNTKSYSNYTAN